MTVASAVNKITYLGNGATIQWSYPFLISQNTDIQVIITDPNGTDTLLDSGYTVDLDTSIVTYPSSGSPLPSGNKITLNRKIPLTQETSLPNQGPYFAKVVEAALDKLTIVNQQQQEQIDRTLKMAISVVDDVSRELPSPVAGQGIGWDNTATGLINMSPAQLVDEANYRSQFVESTGYGIISGLQVSAQLTPNMTVQVNGGTVHMPNGMRFVITAVTALVITTASATSPRIDSIYINSSGSVCYAQGVAASVPVAPTLPNSTLTLANVNVGANATTIMAANITDTRQIKPNYQNMGIVNVKDFGAKGDGITDDAAAIQKAINSNVGVIFIPLGDYYIPNVKTILINRDNISIIGAGKGKTNIISDAAPSNNPIINITSSFVSIKGISFDGGRPVAGDKKSVEITGRAVAINVSAISDINISECEVKNTHLRGIYFLCNNFTVIDSTFSQIGIYESLPAEIDYTRIGAAVTNYGNFSEGKNVSIIGNYFSYCGYFGTLIDRIDGLLERENRYSNMSYIGAGHQWCKNFNTIDNTYKYTADNGIDYQGSSNGNVSKNNFYCAGDGHTKQTAAGARAAIFMGDDNGTFKTSDVIISKNIIAGTFSIEQIISTAPTDLRYQGCGIYVVQPINVTIESNSFRNIGKGYTRDLYWSDADGVAIAVFGNVQSGYLKIINNDITNTKSTAIKMITYSINCEIANNFISKHGLHGIYMESTTDNLKTRIHDNAIEQGTNYLQRTVAADIHLKASYWLSRVSILNNSMQNWERNSQVNANVTVNTTHGVYIDAGNLRNFLCTGNSFTGHSVSEIGIVAGCTALIPGFYFNDNPIGYNDNVPVSADIRWLPNAIPNNVNFPVKTADVGPALVGIWAKGSIIENTNPVAGSYAGWICTVSGTPGTWKGYGLIQP